MSNNPHDPRIEIDFEKLLDSTKEELSNFTKKELKEDPKNWAFEKYLKNFKKD